MERLIADLIILMQLPCLKRIPKPTLLRTMASALLFFKDPLFEDTDSLGGFIS